MKASCNPVKCTLALSLAVTALLLGGCGGGGSGGGGGTAAQNPDPVTINSLQVGSPSCSTVGNGLLNGPVVSATSTSVTLSPSCDDPTATMNVWLAVNSAETNITHYDWEIVGWRSTAPNGGLDKYNELVDVDPVNGRYIVRSYDPQILFVSAGSADLAALTTPFSQEVTVTVWTADGRWGTANFTVTVQPGGTAISTVNGALANTDPPSHGRAGHHADFYQLTGAAATTLTVEGFDTFLYVYDSSRNLIGEADEGANGGGSRLTLSLQSAQTYYVEVTSFAQDQTGPYVLSTTSGDFSAAGNPWAGVTPPNIAGQFNVTEDTTLTIVYDGITTTTNAQANTVATITQSGSSFRYQASAPSGMVPPVTRYGTINGTSISVSGQPFFPINPDIAVTSNTQTASGSIVNNTLTITTVAQLQGTYKGKPLVAQMDSTATFTR